MLICDVARVVNVRHLLSSKPAYSETASVINSCANRSICDLGAGSDSYRGRGIRHKDSKAVGQVLQLRASEPKVLTPD